MNRSGPHDSSVLSTLLKGDLDTLRRSAEPPPAAAVWFRAERRARLDALRRAEQPIWFVERLALVGAGVAIGWLSSVATPWLKTQDFAGELAWLAAWLVSMLGGVPMTVAGVTVLAAALASIGVLVATSGD